MTIKELSQLYHLNGEIEDHKRRLRELEAQRGVCAVQLDDMPHGQGPKRSQVEQLAAEIVDLQAIIHAKEIECIHEKRRLERYIDRVPDVATKRILRYRFMDRMSWVQVANRMGGGNTPDSVRMTCKRYVEKADD